MDINMEFTYHIEKAKEGLYLRIPLEVPENIGIVEFEYNYNAFREIKTNGTDEVEYKSVHTVNAVDFGLEGPGGKQRGTCGNARRSFVLSETFSTPGYIPGPISPGIWNIILGAYKIEENGCTVTIAVKMHAKKAKWLKGDLHLHSINSDGVFEPEELARQAAAMKLDFIAITDHNSWAHNTLKPKVCGVTIIPGMELTYFKGHANLLGAVRPIDTFVANSEEEVAERLKEASETGALVSLNHPFCRSCGWHFNLNQPFEAVEVWNGPMKQQELEAINWWHGELCRGRKLTAIGGSDMHKHEVFRTIATPTTWVFADSDSPSDILKAIRSGQCAISWQPGGPRPELEIGGAHVGETANYTEGLKGKVKVINIDNGDVIRLIDSGGRVEEIRTKGKGRLEYKFMAGKCAFYRVEVWREVTPGYKLLVGLCNPVFIE